MQRSRGWVWVIGVGALVWTFEASAEEAKAASSDAPAGVEEQRAGQRHQLALGLGLQGVALGGGAGAGAAGPLGGVPSPYLTTGFETRLAGPAWLLLEAHGSVGKDNGYGATGTQWSAGGALGVRLEHPVYDFVSVGGYGALVGSYSHAAYEGPGPEGEPWAFESNAFSVCAVFGVGLHFRASSFFGVRLGLELLRAGYSEVDEPLTNSGAAGAFAQLAASPRVALTFTF